VGAGRGNAAGDPIGPAVVLVSNASHLAIRPSAIGAAEILQCRKRAMNGKGQLVNIGRGGRGLATEQTPEESWHPPWTDLQHPIATVNPTRNHLKLRRGSAANYGPTTIPPIVHIAGAPACCNQLGRQTPHQ